MSRNWQKNSTSVLLLIFVLFSLIHDIWMRRDDLLACFQKDDYLLSQALDTYCRAMVEKPPDDILKIMHTNRYFTAKVTGLTKEQIAMELELILDANSNAPAIDKKCIKRFIVIIKGEAMADIALSEVTPGSYKYKVVREELLYWHMRFKRLEDKYRRLKRVAIKSELYTSGAEYQKNCKSGSGIDNRHLSL